MAEPAPPDKFAETHTWIKGQTGAKASNIDRKWTMSKPEHLGPMDRYERLKFIGLLISRQPSKVGGHEEGTFF
eukprot:12912961-Prorocentrum_lima.AAC.1